MHMNSLFYSAVGACLLLSSTAMADVALNGRDATPEMIVRIAKGEAVHARRQTSRIDLYRWQAVIGDISRSVGFKT